MTILNTKFGPIKVRKIASSRRIKLRVLAYNNIQVTAPYAVPLKEINAFIHKNEAWISQTIQRLTIGSYISEGTIIPLFDSNIEIDRQQKDEHSIFIPFPNNESEDKQQEDLKRKINHCIRSKAKEYLPHRCKQLADQHNIAIQSVRIKKVRTRWGSCSIKNNINLSMYLVLFNKEMIDYVIYHELAHVTHKNHSQLFWNHLQELCTNAMELDRQLTKLNVPYQLYMY